MNISFRDKTLEKCYLDERFCKKTLGAKRAKLFLQRLDDMDSVENLSQVKYLPGKFHELVGDRKGQWACDLDQPYRLIFEPHEDPIPTDKNGKYIWIEIKGVEIVEITNYHGK